jgi:ActR/RegA family two-component response regulator
MIVCKTPAVLIVDDDDTICHLVCDGLAEEGYTCDIASSADDALTKLQKHSFDVALLDIKLPGISGMDLLKVVEKNYQTTAIVMISGIKDIDTVVESMKLGALDYIVKPFTIDKLITSIGTVLKNRKPLCEDYNTILSVRESDEDKKSKGQSLSEINAIACGVDAQVDYFDFHSKIVTDKTIELARWLGLPEKEIEKWADARNKFYSERDRRIKTTLSKLERNPMAQVLLGLANSISYFPEHDEEQN